ncbi:MAG: hypothetical protein K2X32_06870 [Phycisphaerales bacterium]|nr:hypothetical protein [Phycisphaerales bacterium]
MTQASSTAGAVSAAIAAVGSGSPQSVFAPMVGRAAFAATAGAGPRLQSPPGSIRVQLEPTRNRPRSFVRVETLTPDVVASVIGTPVITTTISAAVDAKSGTPVYSDSL